MGDKIKIRPNLGHLSFNDIWVDEIYVIRDTSYVGPALCVGKNEKTQQCVFLINNVNYYILHNIDVLKKYTKENKDKQFIQWTCKPIISSINWARKQLGIEPISLGFQTLCI